MAISHDSNLNTKSLHVEEELQGESFDTSDYFFCSVGEKISVVSEDSSYDINDLPSKPLVIAQRFGLVFVAHSSGKLNNLLKKFQFFLLEFLLKI